MNRNILNLFNQEVLLNKDVIDVLNQYSNTQSYMFDNRNCSVEWRISPEGDSLYINVFLLGTLNKIAHISIHFGSFSVSRSDDGINTTDDEGKPSNRPSRDLMFEQNLNKITIGYDGNYYQMRRVNNPSKHIYRQYENLNHMIHQDLTNIDRATEVLSDGLSIISGHSIAIENLLQNNEREYVDSINEDRTYILLKRDSVHGTLLEINNELKNNKETKIKQKVSFISDGLEYVTQKISEAESKQQEFNDFVDQQNEFRVTKFVPTKDIEGIFSDMREAKNDIIGYKNEAEINVNNYKKKQQQQLKRYLKTGGGGINITIKNIPTENFLLNLLALNYYRTVLIGYIFTYRKYKYNFYIYIIL